MWCVLRCFNFYKHFILQIYKADGGGDLVGGNILLVFSISNRVVGGAIVGHF